MEISNNFLKITLQIVGTVVAIVATVAFFVTNKTGIQIRRGGWLAENKTRLLPLSRYVFILLKCGLFLTFFAIPVGIKLEQKIETAVKRTKYRAQITRQFVSDPIKVIQKKKTPPCS